VEGILGELEIEFDSVSLGEVRLKKVLSDDDLAAIETRLVQLGFELLNDRKLQVVEKIKNTIVQIVHHQDDPQKIGHLSEQLPEMLNLNYSLLSKLFSEQEGITIEKYFILQKIEKAKELLKYNEMNITEISDRLNYSSSQHFSRQFKSVTGMSPSEFIKQRESHRKPLDNIK
jgi:AraC-like DNA-binding protein